MCFRSLLLHIKGWEDSAGSGDALAAAARERALEAGQRDQDKMSRFDQHPMKMVGYTYILCQHCIDSFASFLSPEKA